MDPETERQVAALIMEEVSRLRSEAERHGVTAYLAKPKIRGRPNPQFLRATVRGIQQSNRITEVNEMWRRRDLELKYEQGRESRRRQRRSESSSKRKDDKGDCDSEIHDRSNSGSDDMTEDGLEDGLKDEELEQFLHSRVKRGRGAVGSRMDETGPYLPSETRMREGRVKEDWEEKVAGPVAVPVLSRDQARELDGEKWKRNQRDSSVEAEDLVAKKRRKDKKKTNDSKKKKNRRRLEASSRTR